MEHLTKKLGVFSPYVISGCIGGFLLGLWEEKRAHVVAVNYGIPFWQAYLAVIVSCIIIGMVGGAGSGAIILAVKVTVKKRRRRGNQMGKDKDDGIN
jgi:ammonia channel protein AmtB